MFKRTLNEEGRRWTRFVPRDPELPATLLQLIDDSALRPAALRGLASIADPKTPDILLRAYPSLGPEDKRLALNVFVSRPPYASKLLDAIADKRIPSTDVPAEIVRQLRGLKDESLNKRVTEVWGLSDTPADRKKIIAQMKEIAIPSTPPPDLSYGRARICQDLPAMPHPLSASAARSARISPGPTAGPRLSPGKHFRFECGDPEGICGDAACAGERPRPVTGIVKQETPTTLDLRDGR